MLTRREFLKVGAAGVAAAAAFPLRLGRGASFTAATPEGFLTAEELRLVEAATARILPSNDGPGAAEAGVVDYIQGLLSAFPAADANGDGRRGAADLVAVAAAAGTNGAVQDLDGDGTVTEADRRLCTTALFAGRPIFAGGPFSNRNPFPDPATGRPSDRRPRNAFLDHLPLSRVRRLAWTVRLLGADAVPEVAANPLARSTEMEVDLRRRYRQGLADLADASAELFGRPFYDLDPPEQDAVLEELRKRNRTFVELLTGHTIEGFLCPPEYGGNRDLVGWRVARVDGDSQPLGYTIYDATEGVYRERPDKPNSTPEPDEDCRGFSPAMEAFLRTVLVQLTGAEEFPEPYCFEVPS